MLNVGIISTWHVHTNGYADELVNTGKVKLAAVWDEDPARGKEWAEKRGAEFVEDYDAFLARTDFTAVICNSPTTMHLELLSKAAAAGKDIFTEKLLATNTADCEKLCKAIRDAGITFTISLPLRANNIMRYAKKLVDDGKLGRISFARMRRSHSGVSEGWLPDYWFDTAKTGGGAMMDLGAHSVYLLSWIFGAPKRVGGMTTNLYGTSSDENAVAMVEFEGGVIGSCETAFVTNRLPDILEIYGTEGTLFVRGKDIILSDQKGEETSVSVEELEESLPSPIVQFANACIEGTGTPANLGLEDALVMTKIIEATYTSDNGGSYVKF